MIDYQEIIDILSGSFFKKACDRYNESIIEDQGDLFYNIDKKSKIDNFITSISFLVKKLTALQPYSDREYYDLLTFVKSFIHDVIDKINQTDIYRIEEQDNFNGMISVFIYKNAGKQQLDYFVYRDYSDYNVLNPRLQARIMAISKILEIQ